MLRGGYVIANDSEQLDVIGSGQPATKAQATNKYPSMRFWNPHHKTRGHAEKGAWQSWEEYVCTVPIYELCEPGYLQRRKRETQAELAAEAAKAAEPRKASSKYTKTQQAAMEGENFFGKQGVLTAKKSRKKMVVDGPTMFDDQAAA
jgi:hypothetical protein